MSISNPLSPEYIRYNTKISVASTILSWENYQKNASMAFQFKRPNKVLKFYLLHDYESPDNQVLNERYLEFSKMNYPQSYVYLDNSDLNAYLSSENNYHHHSTSLCASHYECSNCQSIKLAESNVSIENLESFNNIECPLPDCGHYMTYVKCNFALLCFLKVFRNRLYGILFIPNPHGHEICFVDTLGLSSGPPSDLCVVKDCLSITYTSTVDELMTYSRDTSHLKKCHFDVVSNGKSQYFNITHQSESMENLVSKNQCMGFQTYLLSNINNQFVVISSILLPNETFYPILTSFISRIDDLTLRYHFKVIARQYSKTFLEYKQKFEICFNTEANDPRLISSYLSVCSKNLLSRNVEDVRLLSDLESKKAYKILNDIFGVQRPLVECFKALDIYSKDQSDLFVVYLKDLYLKQRNVQNHLKIHTESNLKTSEDDYGKSSSIGNHSSTSSVTFIRKEKPNVSKSKDHLKREYCINILTQGLKEEDFNCLRLNSSSSTYNDSALYLNEICMGLMLEFFYQQLAQSRQKLSRFTLYPIDLRQIVQALESLSSELSSQQMLNFLELPITAMIFTTNHWFCAKFTLENNTIRASIADSLGGSDEEAIMSFFELFPDYESEIIILDAVKQQDGHSCGILTLVNCFSLEYFGHLANIDRNIFLNIQQLRKEFLNTLSVLVNDKRSQKTVFQKSSVTMSRSLTNILEIIGVNPYTNPIKKKKKVNKN
eukprot:NODE_717_length_4502_cov_0.079718.p1 type:complete len:718 gc:universal NODE_717_length_4502_cov_0.079718:2227-74(-)